MPANYYVAVRDITGTQVAVIDSWHRLQYEKHRNEPGWIRLEMNLPDDKAMLIDLDYQIEVWRRGDWPGATWYVDMEGLHRRREEMMVTEGGQERYATWAPGYLELLNRRVGAYWYYNDDEYTEDGYFVVTATPPEIIGQYVNREAGPGAIYAGVDRRTPGLSLAAIAPAGAVIKEWFAEMSLLQRVQEIADGHDLDIQIVGIGAGLFEFQVGQLLGTDRRWGTLVPVVFSPELGNMTYPFYIIDHLDEVTFVYVCGQGDGDERMMITDEDFARMGDSPWNRREAWIDAREIDQMDRLHPRGEAALREGVPIYDLSFRLREIERCKYGRDWNWADLVTGEYRGNRQNYKVEAVNVTVDDAGIEIIQVNLIVVP